MKRAIVLNTEDSQLLDLIEKAGEDAHKLVNALSITSSEIKEFLKNNSIVDSHAFKALEAAAKSQEAGKLTASKAAKPRAIKRNTVRLTELVTTRHLAEEIAARTGLPKEKTVRILHDFGVLIAKNLKQGSTVRLQGVGILRVRNIPGKTLRNPTTGKAFKTAPSRGIQFSADAIVSAYEPKVLSQNFKASPKSSGTSHRAPLYKKSRG